MKRIIFHIPFKINPTKPSGTNIRPLKMLEAFRSIGYEVDAIMGSAKERKKQIIGIKSKIKNGQLYDFMYAESATLPTLLTEDHHLPLNPFLDFCFFNFCKKNEIKIGLFYRDIFWNFEEYSLKGIKALYTKSMYHLDLKLYNKFLDVLFVPSLEIIPYIPYTFNCQISALPPGHDQAVLPNHKASNKVLELFYVGGLSSHYQMEELFEAVHQLEGIHLTVCTRKEEWDKAKEENYKKYSSTSNIEIVHKSNKELAPYYAKADIAMIFVEPFEYWSFAIPIKLYEYIGNKKPIIASQNSCAGKFVEENNIGWTIPYKHQALIDLLNKLKKNPSLLRSKDEAIAEVYVKNSWEFRAREVVENLGKAKK